jgi:heme-degrading monooxygenase HmoA
MRGELAVEKGTGSDAVSTLSNYLTIREMTGKSGKSEELANMPTPIDDKAVPILKKQRGFVDEIVLVSPGKADQVMALSFWNKREDAEEYQREQYQKIHDRGLPVLQQHFQGLQMVFPFRLSQKARSNPHLCALSRLNRTGEMKMTGFAQSNSCPPMILNHPTIPLSTARAFAPTAVVSVLTEILLNPPLTFVNYPYRIASSDLTNTLADIFYQSAQPNPATNKSRIAHAKPIAAPRPPRQRLPPNLPIASAPAGDIRCPRDYTAPAHLR